MNDETQKPALTDERGIIRYAWPEIELLYAAGATASDIARNLTADCPECYSTALNTISVRAARHEWDSAKERAQKLAESRVGARSGQKQGASTIVMQTAQNMALERKKNYLERTSGFIDKASNLLAERHLEGLEDAALAAKLFSPVHEIARDIHGLNAREPVAAVQVNFLSDPGQFTVQADEASDKDL